MSEGNLPLCCCEYIDEHGDRNHILACCCNCHELDYCCDRLISCHRIRKSDMFSVITSIKDRLRCPGRGGAFPFPFKMFLPIIIQPLLAVSIVLVSKYTAAEILLVVCFQLLMAGYMTKRKARSPILYYWTISSMIYVVTIFEICVIPMLEIRFEENILLVICSGIAIMFFFMTKRATSSSNYENGGVTHNGISLENACIHCRVKMGPRSYHCNVCRMCISRYDHHSYWLECCIGETNQFMFMGGLLFGGLSLLYGSMLILTTVCRPIFKYGILVPHDCSDVTDQMEMGICYVCGVYCLGLVPILFGQLFYHFCLVSFGTSGLEINTNGIFKCTGRVYSRGFCSNWIYFFRNGFKKMRFN